MAGMAYSPVLVNMAPLVPGSAFTMKLWGIPLLVLTCFGPSMLLSWTWDLIRKYNYYPQIISHTNKKCGSKPILSLPGAWGTAEYSDRSFRNGNKGSEPVVVRLPSWSNYRKKTKNNIPRVTLNPTTVPASMWAREAGETFQQLCEWMNTNWIGSYSWLDWVIMALILSSSDAFASTRLAVYKGVGGKAKKKQKNKKKS